MNEKSKDGANLTDNNKYNLDKIKCQSCKLFFAIDNEYVGIITCPYCGKYVEG
jgi:hypothetical protein